MFKEIFIKHAGEGVLFENSHDAVFEETLMKSLFEIFSSYQQIIFILGKITTSFYSIENAYIDFNNIVFHAYLAQILKNLLARIKNNELTTIFKNSKPNSSPFINALLLNLPSSSIAV